KRASNAVKALQGTSGDLTVNLLTFTMRARDEDISESYMLAGGMTDDGQYLDEEYVADILDLACLNIGKQPVAVDVTKGEPHLTERVGELEKEVQGRNSRYYDQQAELLYRNQQDRKAEHEGKIREYRTKEKVARKAAKQADDPMEQLKLKREARKWERRADEADDDFRDARRKLQADILEMLVMMEQTLYGNYIFAYIFIHYEHH